MKVGIFGGSFNPPHIAHLIVAETLRDQFQLDRILWIPAFRSPHKLGHELAAAEDRLEMVRLATRGNDAFEVSSIEIERGDLSYTVDTLAALQNANPETHYRLIIGSDSLRDFASWYRPEEIVRMAPLLVFRRPGSSAAAETPRLAGRVEFADAPLIEISGTEIRSRCHTGRSIRYLVPPAVQDYIETRGLYRKT